LPLANIFSIAYPAAFGRKGEHRSDGSIPLSLAIGLFMLDLFGFTINQLSYVGLVVALGYWWMTALW